jgi:hypothetical protein
VSRAVNDDILYFVVVDSRIRVTDVLPTIHHTIPTVRTSQEPQFEGRQVVTFHNQRDFIFVRHHRYIYRKENDKTRAKLQELGPRFTLKLKWLQEGTFNTEFGEYEWISKRKQMETSRRKFNL